MRSATGRRCSWAISDTPDQPQQSSFLLLEDGEVIGTPHALHSDIREKGRGLWSHWGQNIFFSSSDGTDPRQNGREYALMKLQHESQVRGTEVVDDESYAMCARRDSRAPDGQSLRVPVAADDHRPDGGGGAVLFLEWVRERREAAGEHE
jgi:hypothetical protein